MTELRPEILAPTHPHLARTLGLAAGVGLIGAALLWTMVPSPAAVPPPPLVMTEVLPVPLAVPVPVTTPAPAPASARAGEVALVFTAGGAAYLKLASLDGEDAEATPRHGKPRVIGDDFAHAAIAKVAGADVPRAYRGWQGRQVVIDGACRATVDGFAVVARLTGDPGFAGDDIDAWTGSTIMSQGAPVLAARLDGCADADGMLARDASLPSIVVPEAIVDPPLALAAKRQLLASADARRAQRAWREGGMEGTWHASESTQWSTLVLRHPLTGDTFVSVHADQSGGCGDPQISIWHLYRADRDGELTRAPSSLGDLTTIEKLVDLEGDGTLEVVGRPWLSAERRLIRASGEELDHLDRPFFGCPC